jgi:hypothetical protein
MPIFYLRNKKPMGEPLKKKRENVLRKFQALKSEIHREIGLEDKLNQKFTPRTKNGKKYLSNL